MLPSFPTKALGFQIEPELHMGTFLFFRLGPNHVQLQIRFQAYAYCITSLPVFYYLSWLSNSMSCASFFRSVGNRLLDILNVCLNIRVFLLSPFVALTSWLSFSQERQQQAILMYTWQKHQHHSNLCNNYAFKQHP